MRFLTDSIDIDPTNAVSLTELRLKIAKRIAAGLCQARNVCWRAMVGAIDCDRPPGSTCDIGKVCGLLGSPPRKRHPATAVAIVMDECLAAYRIGLQAIAGRPKRAQPCNLSRDPVGVDKHFGEAFRPKPASLHQVTGRKVRPSEDLE